MTLTTIQTWSGGPFDLLNPRIEQINLLDIAHSLGKLARFNGHSKYHYSVAQHSLLVMMLVSTQEPALQREALMHDAAEAYIGDIATPMKRALRDGWGVFEKDPLTEMTERIERLIAEKFQLIYPWPIEIHNADKEALRMERFHVMNPSSGVSWEGVGVSTVEAMVPQVTPEQATHQFIEVYHRLTLMPVPEHMKQ